MQPLFAEFSSSITPDKLQVCLADCHDHLTYDTLADLLYTEHPRVLEQTDILIIRPRVDRPFDGKSIAATDLSLLAKRVPHASLHVLFTNWFEISLSTNLNGSLRDKLPTDQLRNECLRWLQDKELYSFIKQSRALFQARHKFIYRAPSKRYVNMFLRVGNVQRSRQVLDAFFFWMLPYLRGSSGVLTDTWSISSIALNAGRLIERYWANLDEKWVRESGVSQSDFNVDMLSSYPDDLLPVLPETQDVLRRVSGDGTRNVLILISAVATGTSLQRLREAVASAQVRDREFSFLALYKLERDPDIPCLCDISKGVGDMTFTPIQRDEVEGRTVIEIDRGAYFPLEIKETPLLIRAEHATPAKDFFTAYRDSNAISLHRNSVDLSNQELRHHGVFIDVEAMIRHSRFEGRLQEQVGRLRAKPLLIVVPPHAAGKVLAQAAEQIIEAKWGDPVRIVTSPDLRGLDNETRELFGSATDGDEILIVDDVSVTGQRLSRYQQSLRELRFVGHVTYLVGVARPDNDKNWERKVRELRFRSAHSLQHDVVCLERVVLPDWDRKTCPWCTESKALARLAESGRLNEGARTEVVARIMALERASIQQGLIDDAIWQPGGAKKPQLTMNSVFLDVDGGPCTEAGVIAAVAAAIQQMRIAKSDESRLEATYPHVTVISPENYFGSRFNDDLLRLAILRSARGIELELWNDPDEERRREMIPYFLYEHEQQETFKLELAVARLANKIPQPIILQGDEKASWPADLWRSFSEPH